MAGAAASSALIAVAQVEPERLVRVGEPVVLADHRREFGEIFVPVAGTVLEIERVGTGIDTGMVSTACIGSKLFRIACMLRSPAVPPTVSTTRCPWR